MSNLQDRILQRGKACLSCRRRKMRCDGARPVCTQCIRGNREDDCEYTDTQGRTRTQVLEENVARLQARIEELENPETNTTSVFLHDPYQTARRDSGSVSASPVELIGSPRAHLRQPTHGSMLSMPIRPGSVPAVLSWWEFEEPPNEIAEMLISEFLPHSQQLHFALHVPRFLATLRLPTLHPSRPHPALLHTIYLWALHLSRKEDLMQHESLYLQRAILALQDAVGGGSATFASDGAVVALRRVHAIQAEVLLAQYFFCLGRYLEGRYHANAAVSLALSSGLHRIQPAGFLSDLSSSPVSPHGGPHSSGGQPMSPISPSTGSLFELAPPRDAIEFGERVNTFWAVYTIDRCWSGALHAPSMLVDDPSSPSSATRVDTPWPLDMSQYELADVYPDTLAPLQEGSRTVQRFLTGEQLREGENSANETSYATLRAKAAALFEYASRIGPAVVNSQGIPQIQASVRAEVQSLARIITSFARGLVPVQQLETRIADSDARRTMLVVHSLAHGAMMQLHQALAFSSEGGETTMSAADICILHAGEIVRILEMFGEDDAGVMDPILGVIWMSAAQVFAQELTRMRMAPLTQASRTRIANLQINIDRILSALRSITNFPAIAYQVSKIQELLQN